ncbi:hypothetical protein ACFSSA_09775 [Luteolibacter algae]|uniref:Uncharacterized protein n=1 Tax=Luteolibacter algae TaxID=454151 RepID=A0ABW5D9C2_9BACT
MNLRKTAFRGFIGVLAVMVDDSNLGAMSRRRRRREKGGKGPWFGKFLIVSGILVVLLAGAGYAGLRAYLHSEKFRRFLSAEVSQALNVNGDFLPFRWDGLAAATDGYSGGGEDAVISLRSGPIATEVGFGGIPQGIWEIKATEIRSVELALDMRRSGETHFDEKADKRHKKKQPGWVPQEVELESLAIGEVSVDALSDAGLFSARGSSLRIFPAVKKKSYKAEIAGGFLDFPNEHVPRMAIERIAATYGNGRLYLTKAQVRAWERGRIEAYGEWDTISDEYSIEGAVRGVGCEEILNADWKKRLSGELTSTYVIDNRSGYPAVEGLLHIENGTMTALPMLDALAAYADTRRFRVLQLSDAHTRWRYGQGVLQLSELVLASEGLVRLEGDLTIQGENIEGRFRLGIVPGILSRIPGAETDVFVAGEEGLLWTWVRVTGTLDDPDEDLTARLLEAAGMRMFERLPESGERVLKFTDSVLGEKSDEVIKKGLKYLDKSDRVLEEAGDILDILLGD